VTQRVNQPRHVTVPPSLEPNPIVSALLQELRNRIMDNQRRARLETHVLNLRALAAL